MSLKDKLREKKKATLPISEKSKKTDISIPQTIDGIEYEIKSYLEQMKDDLELIFHKKKAVIDAREKLVQKLIFVRENKKKLLIGEAYEDFLHRLGIDKSYAYKQIKAYIFCESVNRQDLFGTVDYRIISMIAAEKDHGRQKDFLKRAEKLTREDFRQIALPDPRIKNQIENLLPDDPAEKARMKKQLIALIKNL